MYSHLLYMKSCIWPMSLSLARNTLLSVQSIISLCLYLLMNCLLLNLSIYHISKKFSLYFMSWKVCLVHTLQPSSVFMHTWLTVQFSTPSILGVQSTPTIQYMASSAFLTFTSTCICTYSSTYILHSLACSAKLVSCPDPFRKNREGVW